MSVEVREIKRRIGGVRQIQKATSAMEMIAAARMARDKAAATNSQRYAVRLAQLLCDIRGAAADAEHPLMTASAGENICLLLFGSDKGLCGGFNTALMEKLGAFRKMNEKKNLKLTVMGKIVNRRAIFQDYTVDSFFRQPARVPTGTERMTPKSAFPAEITQIASTVTDSFLKGDFAEVHVLYSKFISPIRQEPVVEKLLPVDFSVNPLRSIGAGREASELNMAIFEPGPAAIFDRLLLEYVRRWIYNAFLNSVASETGARQTAMGRATENAEEMLDELTLTYSRLRQESITTEMLELVGGSMS
jgi:F-type H+-transporting ATPase subunit gamma